MQPLTAKPLPYKELDGLSERQLAEHHDVLYAGYVKKYNEIQEKLAATDRSAANATYSEFGELKREESFALNGIKLHEAYFDSLGGGGECSGAVLDLIKSDCGGFDAWKEDFMMAGIAARGWVVLAFDWVDMRLHDYSCDAHNIGGIWGASPILVLDVYEHAYFLDYGTARKSYIEAFMRNANWGSANRILEELGIVQWRERMDSGQ